MEATAIRTVNLAMPMWSVVKQSAIHDTTSDTATAAAWSTITTDTGALAPRNREFSRYSSPGLCLAAIENMREIHKRTVTVRATEAAIRQLTPERDTLPTSIVTAARTCLARLSLYGLAERDLLVLFHLALYAGQDSLAHEMLMRHLATAHTAPEKTQLLASAARTYRAAAPPRMVAVESLAAQVLAPDSMATKDDVQNWLAMQDNLFGFWNEYLNITQARAVAERVLDFLLTGRATGLTTGQVERRVKIFYQKLLWYDYLENPEASWDSLFPPFAERVRRDLGKASEKGKNEGIPWSVIAKQILDNRPAWVAQTNTGDSIYNARPLRGAMWFPASADTLFPTPGVVSLEYDLTSLCLTDFQNILYNQSCTEPLVQLRQWQRMYGKAGLQITVVGVLQGHALFSGSESPAVEASTIAHYIQDYWNLPVRVAILQQPRRNAEDKEDNRTVIVNRNGRVIYQETVNNVLNGEAGVNINVILRHLFAGTPVSPKVIR